MIGLIVVIGALLLASRLLASRFSSFSRSDTLAAREAAEYGLNEIQARLNNDQYNYLWLTKFNSWSSVTQTELQDCGLGAQDSSGATIAPSPPAGVGSARTISSNSNGTVTYQVANFTPPALADTNPTTANQEEFCSNTTSAAKFGNLNGGSAVISVTGSVTRGSGGSARSTTITLNRRVHVAGPAAVTQLAFSFMILGDAYRVTRFVSTADGGSGLPVGDSFGANSDIATLNYDQGNICYIQPTTNLSKDNCFSPIVLPKTVIGCVDLGSCLINNVDNLTSKKRQSYCRNFGSSKGRKSVRRRKGYKCNDFQQATDLPSTPTPATEGFNSYTDLITWPLYRSAITCDIGDSGANDFANCSGTTSFGSSLSTSTKSYFPYLASIPTSLANAKSLRNNQLVPGCYFNNTNPGGTATGANSTAINCLLNNLTITGAGSKDPNLIIYTTTSVGGSTNLLPVNIFLYGPASTTITLNNGGIQHSDTSTTGWNRLRILGKEVPPAADNPISCAQSTGITSTKGNDLNNLFLWLPNASLNYTRQASRDNAYMVIWACKFVGPTKDTLSGNAYSIITPLPESVVRAGLTTSLGASFASSASGTYRGYGSEDFN